MRFMLLVKSDANTEAGVLPDQKLLADMGKFNEEMTKAKVMLAGDGLQASSKGARVRCNKATKKVTVLDGPFAEAERGRRRILAHPDEVEERGASSGPSVCRFKGGEIEIRPLFELEDFPADPKQEKPEEWRAKEEALRETMPVQTSRGTKKMRFVGFVKGGADSESGEMPGSDALETMGAFVEEGVKAGVFLGGDGLKPTAAGTKVRFDGAKRTVLDGPFAESKEIIAGYSILAVDSKEEAIEWTKRFVVVDAAIRKIPEVECEVRQLFEAEDFPAA